MKIKIGKFKKIDDVEIELAPINIFIGANNSGKSSFIQGIQFSISACQTLGLLKANWTKDGKCTLSLDSKDYLYTPTNDISNLYHGSKLTGARLRRDRKTMKFDFFDEHRSSIEISKGKNGGYTTVLKGKQLGLSLGNIEQPYCVYVPGIAGIPILEKYEVPIVVKKSAARGDSNNYLRNIIYTISNDDEKWLSFISSVNKIYDNILIDVTFDSNVSEYIYVSVVVDKITLPLDSVGTGLLQIIQVFAYIEYFSPKIVLLDEPDSHIHPTKQKTLAKELELRIQNNPNIKIVFSTHSRYILEVLEDNAKVVHFQNGNVFSDVKGSSVLLDIGAADADYLFSKKELKYIIVTEDRVDNIKEKKEFLKKILIANGISENEFVLHSYESCTKVDFAKILEGFVRKQIPTAKVILHVDRDQKLDSDEELLKLRDKCKRSEILLFVTKYQEIESYFCTPEHISEVYDIDIEKSKEKYEELIASLKNETIRKLSNFILRERPLLGMGKNELVDINVVNKQANEWYDEFKYILTPGKELLSKVKKYAQEELKRDPNKILEISRALICDDLKKLLTKERS